MKKTGRIVEPDSDWVVVELDRGFYAQDPDSGLQGDIYVTNLLVHRENISYIDENEQKVQFA